MNANEQIIRETCAAAEGRALDTEKFVSAFSEDGYMWDMASGTKFRGKGIGDCIAALASAFPDVHREILKVHVAGDVVIVELAIRRAMFFTSRMGRSNRFIATMKLP